MGMKKVIIIFVLIIMAGAIYFFWPNKEVTRCGILPQAQNGKLIQSCGTCVCSMGIPYGFNSPACIGGEIISCTQFTQEIRK